MRNNPRSFPTRASFSLSLWLGVSLVALVALPLRWVNAASEAELRMPITTYFAGLEARSVDAALSQWSTKSPYLAAQRQGLSAQFARFDETRVRNLKWVSTRESAEGAWLRVSLDLETREASTGKRDTSLTGQRRVFQLVPEGAAWRIWRYTPAERPLAEALLHAPDAETRSRLLQEDADLLGPVLIQQLRAAIAESEDKTALPKVLDSYAMTLQLAERIGDNGELGRMLLDRATTFYQHDQYADTERDLLRALSLLNAPERTSDLGQARYLLGMTYVLKSRFREAVPQFEAYALIGESLGATKRIAQARYWLGFSRHSLLDHAGALPAYQSSAELYRQIMDGTGEARALRKVGDIYKVLHRDADAVEAWQRSADLYRDNNAPRDEAEVLYDIGLTSAVQGRYAAAYVAQFRRLKVAVALKDPKVLADSLSAAAGTLGVLGKTAEAVQFLEAELPLRRQIPDAPGEAHALRDLGDAYRDLYRIAAAYETYEKALQLTRQIKDQDQEARTLASIARLQGERGDYLRAAESGEQALRLFRELKLKSHEAEVVRELGKQYRAQGRHAEALAQFDVGLALDREAEDLLGAARDLDEAAQDHLLTGRFQDALTVYRSALKVYQEAKLRLGEADIQNKLGAALQKLGRYAEAEAAFQQSFDTSKELDIEAGQAQARANLAGLHTTTGRYAEAIPEYEAVLATFRRLHSRSSEGTVLTNMGKLYSSKGDLARAMDLHQAALALYRDLNDGRSIAQELHSIAEIQADRGRYAEALAGFAEALKVFRAAGLRVDEAITLAAQGGVYRELGQSAEALAQYEAARGIYRETGNRGGLARVQANIGGLFMHDRQYAKALDAYQDSLKTVRALGEKPVEPGLLNNLGLVHRAMGHPVEARKALEESLAATRALGRRSEEASALGNLGYLEAASGNSNRAEQTYREALKVADESGLPEVSFRCWFGLALVHRDRKDWRTAARDLARSTGLIERIRGEVKEQSLQSSFLEQYVSPFHLQADCLLRAGEPGGAFAAGERAKARALVDVLRNGKASVSKAMSPAEREAEEKLEGRLTSLSVELRDARFLPTDQRLARETQLVEVRTAFERFRRQLYLEHPQLQVQRGAYSPPTLTELNRTLFAKESGLCVFSYVVGKDDTLLFALTRGAVSSGPAKLSVYRLPVARQVLDEQVQAFWNDCSQAEGPYRTGAAKLYRTLVLPAERELSGKTHLVLVPDGPLLTLPFQALLDSTGKHLLERVPLSYAPSVSAAVSMTQLGERRRAERPAADSLPLLAFGRPKLDAGLPDLPETEKEVRTISSLFGAGAETLLGADASEERAKAEASRARCLHLATHGLLNATNGMYSALALAHGPKEDGRLEARELLELDLHANLVVLSACETALGTTVRSEGVKGLAWSLFVAGAPSTLLTHWQVEDETTGTLMSNFYRRMAPAVAKGMPPAPPAGALSKARALRAAQLALMHDGKHAHPYFWAPFVLEGDWRGGVR